MNDPYEVKKIIQRTPEAAYESLYKQVEQAYSDNKKINEGKVRNFQCLLLESTGRWASRTHQELCRGSEHGAIRKAIWGWPGQPAKLVVAIHCR